MWLIGGIGLPYYLFTILIINTIAKETDWAFLLIIPSLYIYDLFSQNGYKKIVHKKGDGKIKYCFLSIFYQFIFMLIIFGLNWLVKT